MLKFFNTLARRKEDFLPLKKNEVRMYTCGPTVYDYAHIGNFRTYIFEDLLRRYLKFKGFRVTQVMNITDIDDKTIRGSRKAGVSLAEYTEKYKEAFFEDIQALRTEKAEFYPCATAHISEMAELIKKLIIKAYAYRSEDGSIYFNISRFANYGALSHMKLKKLKSGARVSNDEYEKDEAADFVLWKSWSSEDGDVYWEPPFPINYENLKIKGRPGWHIECSAMSMKYLGESFDIHTGGVDNMFPHHENEIAQSECATGAKYVNYWLHSEHLLVEGKKMSKSLGNFYTLRDLIKKGHDPLALRYLLLSSHYRSQMNFTFGALDDAKNTVDNLNEFVMRLEDMMLKSSGMKGNEEVPLLLKETENKFEAALDDDLNMPLALSHLFDMIKAVNKAVDEKNINVAEITKTYEFMLKINKILDILRERGRLTEKEKQLIEKRQEFRKKKKYEEADMIRSELRERGVMLEDTPEGVRWRKIK